MNFLLIIAAICMFVGVVMVFGWLIFMTVWNDWVKWPGLVGAALCLAGLILMVPAVCTQERSVTDQPTIRAEAFTVEAQTRNRSGNKTYVVQVDNINEMCFYDFEIGSQEYVEYRTSELGNARPERLVVSEKTAEALGRVQIGK